MANASAIPPAVPNPASNALSTNIWAMRRFCEPPTASRKANSDDLADVRDSSSVAIYSDTTMDSPSQNLARYAKLIGERYLPSMKVNIEFMQDRLGRGGDHTPFQQEGYAAVRLSTPNEIYANQHHDTDKLESMSVPYTTRVATLP